MNDKAPYELDFWWGLVNDEGVEEFLDRRYYDFRDKTKYLDDIYNECGKPPHLANGLDLGCGLVSIFEYAYQVTNKLADTNYIYAVDPLFEEYNKIIPMGGTKIRYGEMLEDDQIPFPSAFFDWIYCVNVLDHTPTPEALVKEIKRTLKDGGRLYFGVNFDDDLQLPHYQLMNFDNTSALLRDFKCKKIVIIRNDADNQYNFWGTYIK